MENLHVSLGTIDFSHKFKGMRKDQEFCVYPMNDGQRVITIQSDTRIGKIFLNTGRVIMSKSHSNGALFHHIRLDVLTKEVLSKNDLDTLKAAIRTTGGKDVGNSVLTVNNSGASLI